jgi:hypothetical protein
MNTVKLGRVERDPIIPDELPKTAFPACYIETTDEDIEDITLGTTKQLREGMMLVNVVVLIGGKQRDKQRNLVVEAIENKLLTDRTVNSTATHIALTGVESMQVGESAPYASVRMVFTVKHHYTIT